MLWVLIVRLFGGLLPFKRRIESCRSPRLRILYLLVWQEYLGRLESWIGYNANIREVYFPH